MKKIISCDLCGSKKFNPLFRAEDQMYGIKQGYFLVQCSKCGLILVNPQPTGKELSKHYPAENYYSLEKNSDKSYLKELLQNTYYSRGKNMKKLLLLPLKPFINSIKIVHGGKFLDVGCGSGNLLRLVSKLGMQSYGVEPGGFNREISLENNIKIFNGELIKAKYPSNYFEVIILNHVLEHVSNPTETLKELRRIIKADGVLIIGTPTSNSFAYRIFGKNWLALDTPRHLHIFSDKLLGQYAKKTGFIVQRIKYNSSPLQFAGSLFYVLNSFKKRKITLDSFLRRKYLVMVLYLLFTIPAYICNLLNIGDQLEIFLKPN